MTLPERRTRREREQRAFALAVTSGGAAVATVVLLVLSIAGVVGFGLVLLAAIVAGVTGYLFRRTVS